MKPTSIIKPPMFKFERYPRGGYILWLRDNFKKVTKTDEQGETYTSWVYDEYTMLTPTFLSNEFIEQHFDEYFAESKRIEAMKTDKRLLFLESAVDDLANLIGGIIR